MPGSSVGVYQRHLAQGICEVGEFLLFVCSLEGYLIRSKSIFFMYGSGSEVQAAPLCLLLLMSSCLLFPLSLSGAVIPQCSMWMISSSLVPPASWCVKPLHSFLSPKRLANVQGMQRWLLFAAASSCQYLTCSLLVNTSTTDWLDYVVCHAGWVSYWLNEWISCWVTGLQQVLD